MIATVGATSATTIITTMTTMIALTGTATTIRGPASLGTLSAISRAIQRP
jgi:hypothetical protein